MAPAEPPPDMEQLLGGLHEWHDAQAVVRTTFKALCDVAHAQSQTVRDMERKLTEVHDELTGAMVRKADAAALRAAEATANDARTVLERLTRRVEEEAQCSFDAQRLAAEEVQSLRSGLTDLRSTMERQRMETQQWRAGLEAGLSRLATECSSATQTVQSECRAELQSASEELRAAILEKAAPEELREIVREGWLQEAEELRTAISEKAAPEELREIVREAWHREEGHLARIQRICDSKVSSGDFAALAALTEGKASMADLDVAIRREVSKRVASLIQEQQLQAKNDSACITENVAAEARKRVLDCEQRVDEIVRRHKRIAATADELRAEIRAVAAAKLERAEAEAIVAGALTDWVRAAQRGADAVQAAVQRGRSGLDDEGAWCGFDGIPPVTYAEGVGAASNSNASTFTPTRPSSASSASPHCPYATRRPGKGVSPELLIAGTGASPEPLMASRASNYTAGLSSAGFDVGVHRGADESTHPSRAAVGTSGPLPARLRVQQCQTSNTASGGHITPARRIDVATPPRGSVEDPRPAPRPAVPPPSPPYRQCSSTRSSSAMPTGAAAWAAAAAPPGGLRGERQARNRRKTEG